MLPLVRRTGAGAGLAAGVIGMDKPVCSVCVANYNGLAMLAGCLDSVLLQKGGWPVEIIVHDDASSDASVAFVRERYPGVVLIESRENVGFCIANNRMAAVATGDFLLLLNNDAALWPDALVTLLAAARALERPAILGLPQYEWDFNATCQGSIEHIIWFMHAGRFTVTSEFRPLGNIPYIVDTSHCELVMLSPESLPSSQQAWQSFK